MDLNFLNLAIFLWHSQTDYNPIKEFLNWQKKLSETHTWLWEKSMEKLFLSMKYMERAFVTNNKYSYHTELTLKALHNPGLHLYSYMKRLPSAKTIQ